MGDEFAAQLFRVSSHVATELRQDGEPDWMISLSAILLQSEMIFLTITSSVRSCKFPHGQCGSADGSMVRPERPLTVLGSYHKMMMLIVRIDGALDKAIGGGVERSELRLTEVLLER